MDKFYCGGPFRQCVVIGGQSDTVAARISLTGSVNVESATGNEDAGLVYLGTFSGISDYVATVRAQDDSVLATTTIGQAPYGIASYGNSGLVYCASAGTDEVCVLTSDGAHVLATLQVGAAPYVFAAVPRHNRLYLGHLNGGYVYVLKDTSAAVAESQPARPGFGGVSVTPNPFTNSVAVVWDTPLLKDGGVVRVFAQDGSVVRQARVLAGQASWAWNGRDDTGKATPSGVYVVETGAGGRQKVVKLR